MSVNKVILLGNLGKDPDVKTIDSSNTVYNFSLALSEKYKNKSGELVETTEWVNVVAWNMKACEYLKKGSQCYLEGRIKTRSYESDGQKKYITEVMAERIQLLNSKQDSQSNNPQPPQEIRKEGDDQDLPF